MIPNYEPQLRPTFPQATTNPNYDQLRQKQTHPKNVAIATNYPTTNPNYDQLRPLRRLATTTAPPPKGGASRSWDGSSRCRKNRSKPNNQKPAAQKEESNTKETASDANNHRLPWTNRPPQKYNNDSYSYRPGQHLRGSPTCKPHRHRQAAFGDTPTPYRIEQARKQPDLVAASANRYE